MLKFDFPISQNVPQKNLRKTEYFVFLKFAISSLPRDSTFWTIFNPVCYSHSFSCNSNSSFQNVSDPKYGIFLASNGEVKAGEATSSKGILASEMMTCCSNKILPDGRMNHLLIEVKTSEKKQIIACYLNDTLMTSSFSFSEIEPEKYPFSLENEFSVFGGQGIDVI